MISEYGSVESHEIPFFFLNKTGFLENLGNLEVNEPVSLGEIDGYFHLNNTGN